MKWIGWGVIWRSEDRLDGKREHLLFENRLPRLFFTRREAREYAEKRYGYIRKRKDLRDEPHGWKMPVAARVAVDKAKEPSQ